MSLRPPQFGSAAVLFAFILVGQAASAYAAPITFSFTGTVSGFDPSLSGTFNTSQTLSGSMTFDSSSVDQSISFSVGSYPVLVPNSLSFSIEGYSGAQTGPSTGTGVVQVLNDSPDIWSPVWTSFTAPMVGSSTPVRFRLFLSDPTGAVFSSDALPLTPPLLSAFSVAAWELMFSDPTRGVIVVAGNLDSLTAAPAASALPEPSSLLLVGTGLLVAAVRRSKRRPA